MEADIREQLGDLRRERKEVAAKVFALEKELAELLSPLKRGDVIRWKSADWVVMNVRPDLLDEWAVDITTVSTKGDPDRGVTTLDHATACVIKKKGVITLP